MRSNKKIKIIEKRSNHNILYENLWKLSMSAAHCITQKGYDRHRRNERPSKNCGNWMWMHQGAKMTGVHSRKKPRGMAQTTLLQECAMSGGIQSEHILSTNRWSISRWKINQSLWSMRGGVLKDHSDVHNSWKNWKSAHPDCSLLSSDIACSYKLCMRYNML
jgi:hypothetical protein